MATIYVNHGGRFVSAEGGAARACELAGGRLATPEEIAQYRAGSEFVGAPPTVEKQPRQVVNSLPADVPPEAVAPPPADDPDAPPPADGPADDGEGRAKNKPLRRRRRKRADD